MYEESPFKVNETIPMQQTCLSMSSTNRMNIENQDVACDQDKVQQLLKSA